MDIFDEEILKFWAALQKTQVKYIMVEGYAMNLHGYQRFTGDIDIWIEDTLKNRQRLREAFTECGMGDYYMLETIQFVPGWTDFHLMNGLRLDMAAIADIDGVQVPFLHINQLISNKKAVNRPKDQQDVIELEKILKIQSEL